MKQPDVRYAMMSREWGLRRVRRLTWGIAGAGAVGAIALVVGFGGHVHVPKISQPAQGQAPAGNQDAGNQGTAGQQAGNQVPGGGQLQPPAANPVPAQGPGQVVSGGS
jgi:hypothetical protein